MFLRGGGNSFYVGGRIRIIAKSAGAIVSPPSLAQAGRGRAGGLEARRRSSTPTIWRCEVRLVCRPRPSRALAAGAGAGSMGRRLTGLAAGLSALATDLRHVLSIPRY